MCLADWEGRAELVSTVRCRKEDDGRNDGPIQWSYSGVMRTKLMMETVVSDGQEENAGLVCK